MADRRHPASDDHQFHTGPSRCSELPGSGVDVGIFAMPVNFSVDLNLHLPDVRLGDSHRAVHPHQQGFPSKQRRIQHLTVLHTKAQRRAHVIKNGSAVELIHNEEIGIDLQLCIRLRLGHISGQMPHRNHLGHGQSAADNAQAIPRLQRVIERFDRFIPEPGLSPKDSYPFLQCRRGSCQGIGQVAVLFRTEREYHLQVLRQMEQDHIAKNPGTFRYQILPINIRKAHQRTFPIG